MPDPRIDARRLLAGEALFRSTLLGALAAALLLSSLPFASVLLAVATAASVWAVHHSAAAVRGRVLCWNGDWYWDSASHGDGKPCADPACQYQEEGREERREEFVKERPQARREISAERLRTVGRARVCFGFLLLRVAGPESCFRVMVCMPLLDRETRRGLLLACRR